ncbi:MAG: ATP-binding protein [Deltaproteobacteria bacterium]|nr:ATP-binding protein [Deltaproteobacteria bacterium]
MKRNINNKLLQWGSSTTRKPLILKGARQTGKTYSLLAFGSNNFSNCHHLDFQQNKELGSVFEKSLNPTVLIEGIEFFLDQSIDVKNDLLIFDEIQECPRALTSLKYFCEQMPGLAICCAGSLLGVTHSNSPFPVGKVDFLDLHPMSFSEFLVAINETRSADTIMNANRDSHFSDLVHQTLMKLLREYFVVGGMPEIVDLYRRQRQNKMHAFELVRTRQRFLLDAYTQDFAKYSDSVPTDRIMSIWNAIPAQLAKTYKKFVASKVIPKGRYSNLQSAIDWLQGAGLIILVPATNSGELPFSAFTKENNFKLYFFDTGLLGALADLSPGTIYMQNDPFVTFRGAFCENYVAQEFVVAGTRKLFSWKSNTSELEFLREVDGSILPIEVKAGKSGKLKSLNVFASKYKCPYRTRISARNLELNTESQMHSYPLYLASRFPL